LRNYRTKPINQKIHEGKIGVHSTPSSEQKELKKIYLTERKKYGGRRGRGREPDLAETHGKGVIGDGLLWFGGGNHLTKGGFKRMRKMDRSSQAKTEWGGGSSRGRGGGGGGRVGSGSERVNNWGRGWGWGVGGVGGWGGWGGGGVGKGKGKGTDRERGGAPHTKKEEKCSNTQPKKRGKKIP